MSFKHVHLQCACHHPDHIVRVTLDKSENPPELSITPQLNNHLPWYRRLVVAFKYLFNIKVRDSHWGSYHYDNVLLTEEGVNALSNLIVTRRVIQKLRKVKKRKGRSSRLATAAGLNPVEDKTLGGSTPSPTARSK
jgi:hypothetical protein